MLNKNHKLLELKTNALTDSLFVWNYKTNHKWRGIEFVDYKEYDFWDNIKYIDFIKSEQEWKTLVKLYEEERELSVNFIIDLNSTFYSWWLPNNKIDIVYELFYLIWLSTIKSWDKLWTFIFSNDDEKLHIAKKWKQNFINIVNSIDLFEYKFKQKNDTFLDIFKKWNKNFENKKNKKKWLSYFNSLRIKNSLVFYITDNLDIDSKQLKILWIKNDLIVCNIFNSFENTLEWKGILWLKKWENNIFLDLDNKDKILKYKELRKNKILDFKKKIIRNWAKYILLDERKNIYKEFYKLFRK